MVKHLLQVALFSLVLSFSLTAQQNAGPHDFGKMWTFENPPTEWFNKTYDMDVQEEWFDYVRKSSLKLAFWCSASFISDSGLIMTNHHCSRDVVTSLQQDGENFDKHGFYAERLEDERKADGLFVEQMLKDEDITHMVLERTKNAKDDNEELAMQKEAMKEIENIYKDKEGWENLRLQTVSFYSGGKFSIYGFKKYTDIRLVWIPELDLGFFGGDPDNFTYPRYNLDATFWRAYDDDGQPLNTSDNYFKFNKDGAVEGEPVFVIGNPGRTERYRTVAQLEYDRDYRYPFIYKFLKNRNDLMMENYNKIKNDPEQEYEAQAMLNRIANIANSMKVYGGITKGLNDPELFGRKVEMEDYIRAHSPGVNYWSEIAEKYKLLSPHGWAIADLAPSAFRGSIYSLMHDIVAYKEQVVNNASDTKLSKSKSSIEGKLKALEDNDEIESFKLFLTEAKEDIYPGDMTLEKIMGNRNIDDYVSYLLNNTLFTDDKKVENFFSNKDMLSKNNDPMIVAADIFVSRYKEANELNKSMESDIKILEGKVAKQVFKIYGDNLPPDATFTLRISDGVIKGFNYNGTVAPEYTTYFGLYDRYYSHHKEFPWSLPERWQNPSLELLKAPLNTVSTNDIIGGNSGSPLINKNKEVVGLIFDGNIESLPGNFIFDEESNRAVSVHAGGIYAALKYMFKADRIIKELDK